MSDSTEEWRVVIEWTGDHPEHCIDAQFTEKKAWDLAKRLTEWTDPKRVKRFRVERRTATSWEEA